MKFSSSPVVPFRHLQRLTDPVGVVARADGIMPRHGDGYQGAEATLAMISVLQQSHRLAITEAC